MERISFVQGRKWQHFGRLNCIYWTFEGNIWKMLVNINIEKASRKWGCGFAHSCDKDIRILENLGKNISCKRSVWIFCVGYWRKSAKSVRKVLGNIFCKKLEVVTLWSGRLLCVGYWRFLSSQEEEQLTRPIVCFQRFLEKSFSTDTCSFFTP